MHTFRDIVRTLRPGTPSASAPSLLFPELAGGCGRRPVPGILRAPPRGAAPAPCLSAVMPESTPAGAAASVASPGPASPGQVLARRGWERPVLLARAAAARRALASQHVGGDWWQGACDGALPAGSGYAVVAADRIDADAATTAAMLQAALAENPAGRTLVLAPRSGAAAAAIRRAPPPGTAIIDRPVDPWALFERAGRVYTDGGELGFLALVAGLPVTAFGAAFYTGWGATDDDAALPRHAFGRSVDEIFAAACLLATRYRDPFHRAPTSFEAALAILADWRRAEAANRSVAVCVGMSFWKRRRIADFVRSAAGVPPFRRGVAGALAAAQRHPGQSPGAIAGWASRLPPELPDAAARAGVPLIRVEDGFIRSVGLGSDFLPPASLVFDRSGMYYDPRSISDLECLLRDTDFAPALLDRARSLAALLVTRGITKYNHDTGAVHLDRPPNRLRILVPGQVEDDLSIRFGSGTVRTNLALLAQVRAANPDAFILYKPHPDVLAGHRVGAVPAAEAGRFADTIVTAGSTASWLEQVDELHTMTSLAGFEALLRGRRVVAYGRPFYAGWGLTDDRPAFERGRRLSLDELVAGALILYPRYLDPLTRLPCGPEIIIERLARPELWRPGPLVLARRLQGVVVRRLSEARALLSTAGAQPARRLRERPRP